MVFTDSFFNWLLCLIQMSFVLTPKLLVAHVNVCFYLWLQFNFELVLFLSFQVFARHQVCKHYVHQMSLFVRSQTKSLPKDVSAEYPSYACLLGNILEASALVLSEADSSFEMVLMLKFYLDSCVFHTLFHSPQI